MTLTLLSGLALSLLPLAALHAQDRGAEHEPDETEAWSVAAPPGAWHPRAIDVREGTWMNVDVHPDGSRIVFDLLGDIYTLPLGDEGDGEARRIASGIAWQMQPRYSPDGTRIAFTSDEGGGDNLWVMDADGSNARAVTDEDFRLVSSPCWTPDGRWLAGRKHFTSRRSLGAGEIWLYHADEGGGGLQLTEKANEQKDVGEPAFSPDGRYLYTSADTTPGDTFEYSKDVTAGIYSISRLDLETGEVERLLDGPGGACRPTPSHDGTRLAFVRRVRFRTTLFVLDLASGAARPLWDGLERDMQETWAIHGVYPTMAWTPDDRELVTWAQGGLWRVDVATGAARRIAFHVADERSVQDAVRRPVAVAPDDFPVRALRSVVTSPRGDLVAYQALGHIWIRPLPDGEPRRLTTQTDHFEFEPAFNRDGSWIVYTTWDDDALGSIRVATVNSGAGVGIGAGRGHFVEPTFSPDGKHVVYRRVRGGYITSPHWSADPGVYVVGFTDDRTVTEPRLVRRGGTRPQFGADSERVFLTERKGGKDSDDVRLISVRLDGSDEREHAKSDWATDLRVSPDGKWLAFAERYKVYVAPFVATGRSVTLGPKTDALPVARVSAEAGNDLHWSGASDALSWSLGPVLYTRALAETFAWIEGAPEELPEPVAKGRAISFRQPTAAPEGAVAFVGGRIVTMRGDEVLERGTLVIDGPRIAAVGAAGEVAVPEGARVIDATGTTLVPGLIDVHYHGATTSNGMTPEANWVHGANLAFGVTTAHDPSHDTASVFAVSELQRAGLILAPRLFSTGTILYGAQGSFKSEVDSVDDARSHLLRQQAFGAFSVKSYNQPRRDQRQQVLAAARELGMMVVPEGGSTLQHNLTMVVDGHTGVEHSLPVENVYADVTQLWGPSGVGYTPTLVVGYGGIWGENYWYDKTDVWRDERLNTFVPRFVLDPRSRRRTKAPDEDYNHLRSARICKALVDAGANVQLGAHGQLAGLGAHWELWMFAQGGLTNHEALRSATLSGAEYLGLDGDLGSLEPGKLADLIVIEGDPLEDLRASARVRYTVLNGRVLDARTLAPADGRPGAAPTYFWRGEQDGQPYQTTDAGCVGCTAH